MARETPPHGQRDTPPSKNSGGSPGGDPWQAFGYLVAGVLLYGAVGWLLDYWLGTSFLVVVGILFGAGLGIYATWMRFRIPDETDAEKRGTGSGTSNAGNTGNTGNADKH